jgi:hypothetical protein
LFFVFVFVFSFVFKVRFVFSSGTRLFSQQKEQGHFSFPPLEIINITRSFEGHTLLHVQSFVYFLLDHISSFVWVVLQRAQHRRSRFISFLLWTQNGSDDHWHIFFFFFFVVSKVTIEIYKLKGLMSSISSPFSRSPLHFPGLRSRSFHLFLQHFQCTVFVFHVISIAFKTCYQDDRL